MTNYEIIEKFESDKVKSSLDIAGGVFVETDLVHEIVKALRSQPCEDTISRQAAIDAIVNTPSEVQNKNIPLVNQYDGAAFRQIEILGIIEALPSAQPDARLKKIADLVDGTIDHFDRDDAMDLLYQIKEVLK